MIIRILAFVVLGFAALSLGGQAAYADCASPVGTEGKIIYNSDHKVAQFCNGTDWIGMAGGASSSATDTMVDGWPDAIVCNNGTTDYFLYHNSGSGGAGSYSALYDGQAARYYIQYSAGGAYSAQSGVYSAYDCVTGSMSIADLYAAGQAFNFIGGSGDGTDTLSDLSCTSGQVASWNGTAWACAAAGADNLGDHTATQDLDMGNFDVNNAGYVDFTGVAGDVPVSSGVGSADNLGDHTATTNIQLGTNYLSGDGGNEGIYVDADGNVGIGTASPSVELEIDGDVLATSYLHSSDVRLKDSIETIDGLGIISRLRGVTYNWKKDGAPSAGVIAQELEVVMPRAVSTGNDGMKAVEYDQLIAPLIEAVKAQQVQIEAMQREIDALKGE